MPESDTATSAGAEQSPQEPEELQRDTADGDGSPAAGLTERQQRTLLRLLRVAYPHPSFPDAPYERTAKAVEDADARPTCWPTGWTTWTRGPAATSRALDDDATAVVEQVADGAFFRLVHTTTVVALYDDHEVWDLLGYEGPSFDKGGYLHRGFDDLDWLPDPRIEEYDGRAAGRAGRRRRAPVSDGRATARPLHGAARSTDNGSGRGRSSARAPAAAPSPTS